MQDFWTFFAFPLNLILAVLWAAGWGWSYKNRPESHPVRFMLSPAATISSIVLLVVASLWIGLSGDRDFVRSVVFVLILLYLQTVLYMVLLRGWRRRDGVVRWRFILLHLGLLLAVGAGFWGSPDSTEYRVRLQTGESTDFAYRLDGSTASLFYKLTLKDFRMETAEDGQPSFYEAEVAVNDRTPVNITVNHPYSVRMREDIYLASLTADSCILQIVREPWRYFALAGIIMMLAGAFILFLKGPGR